jgi:hypothetical protein
MILSLAAAGLRTLTPPCGGDRSAQKLFPKRELVSHFRRLFLTRTAREHKVTMLWLPSARTLFDLAEGIPTACTN